MIARSSVDKLRRHFLDEGFVFLPLDTDAPIYHFPKATIGLIVANVVAFVLTGVGFRPDLTDPWILYFGRILPHQWLTAMFIHINGVHLLGNMIFLWAFGLIIEGKLGWKRFLTIYLLLGTAQSGIEQVIMCGADREAMRQQQARAFGVDAYSSTTSYTREKLEHIKEQNPIVIRMLQKQPVLYGALGASGAIYSLIAMSLIWGPKNELTVWFVFAKGTFEITILNFALWYISLDFLFAWIMGFSMNSSFLHIMGAIFGAGAGVYLLKKKVVDCEEWDLFSVLSGEYGASRRDMYGYRVSDPKDNVIPVNEVTPIRQSKIDQITDLVRYAEYAAASEALLILEASYPGQQLAPADHARLAVGLMLQERFEEAEVQLESFVEKHPDNCDWALVRLAAIQFQENKQPNAALHTLGRLDASSLTQPERKICQTLLKYVSIQIDAGVEDEDHEW